MARIWCPCCGYRLRTKPRNKKYKYNQTGTQRAQQQGGQGQPQQNNQSSGPLK